MHHPVQTAVYFLERSDLWLKEKPFFLDYTPAPPAVKSNAKVQPEAVLIEDIRGREDEFTFTNNGFCILPLNCDMEGRDFDCDEKVRRIYLSEVGESVKKALGASRVQIYDYLIRKRDAQFPTSTGEYYSHKQPASIAHVDTTPAHMEQMLQAMNPDDADRLGQQHHQSVNVWRPLRGPLRDWPLTLCDPRTVTVQDLIPRDTVKRETFIETYQIHHVPTQKWYYISDQMPQEAWMFLQADSSPDGMLGVPHSSFPCPMTTTPEVPRESIEVRCLVFYDELCARF